MPAFSSLSSSRTTLNAVVSRPISCSTSRRSIVYWRTSSSDGARRCALPTAIPFVTPLPASDPRRRSLTLPSLAMHLAKPRQDQPPDRIERRLLVGPFGVDRDG